MIKLSDVLTKEVIEQSEYIVLIHGKVGVGKTYWVGTVLLEDGSTVLVLSALRTVINQIKNEFRHKNLHLFTFAGFVNRFVKNRTIEELDKVVAQYDYIVIDEAHDLVSFSGFMREIIPIRELILRNRYNKKIILLSATPLVILLAYGSENFNQVEEVKALTTTAKPKKFVIVDSREQIIDELLSNTTKNKALYYIEKVKDAEKLEEKLVELGIRAVAIVGESSDNGKRIMKSDHRRKALEVIERTQKFPNDVDVIIATTKLREGVSFNDKRIELVATEIMDIISMIQISGRVRHGVSRMIGLIKKGKMEVNPINFWLLKRSLIEDIEVLNKVYQAISKKLLRQTLLDGISKKTLRGQKYSRYNEFFDAIEFNIELFTKDFFELFSQYRINENPVAYVRKYLEIDNVEIKLLDEERIRRVKDLMVEYKGATLIYGNEKKMKLKKILGVDTTYKIRKGLDQLGFNYAVITEMRINGVREITVYKFIC